MNINSTDEFHIKIQFSNLEENKTASKGKEKIQKAIEQLPENLGMTLVDTPLQLQKVVELPSPLPSFSSHLESPNEFWKKISDLLMQNPFAEAIEIEGQGSFTRSELEILVPLQPLVPASLFAQYIRNLHIGEFFERMKEGFFPPMILHVITGKEAEVATDLQTTPVDSVDKRGATALQWAAFMGFAGIVSRLIQAGAKKDIENNILPPLPQACLSGSVETVRVLLNAGADITYIDKTGRSVLWLLESRRPPHWQLIYQLIKIHSIHPEEACNYAKQYKQTKLMSHAFAVKGSSHIQGRKINWEAGTKEIAAITMASSAKQFAEQFPSLLDEASAQHLAQSLQFAADHKSRKLDQYLHGIQRGMPTFFLTGYQEHGTTVLIWNDLFILCDRNRTRSIPLEIYHYDRNKLTRYIIQRLLLSQSAAAYLNNIQNVYPKELNFTQTAADKQLQTMASLPLQIVGNCGWASTEGAVKAYLLLAKLQQEGFTQNLQNSIDQTFSNWLLFQQLSLLDSYIEHEPDAQLILQSFLVLWTTRSNHASLEKSLLKQIDALEAKYLAQAPASEGLIFRTSKLGAHSTVSA